MSQAGIVNTKSIPPPPGSVTDLQGQDGVTVPPNGSGIIHVAGTTVAAGSTPFTTTGNAGTNTETWSIQRTQAIGSTDATKVGLASFNSAQFSVDSNGFVSSTQVDLHITPYIVSASGISVGASFTTIQAALTAANGAGGGIVYVQPGTYTENLTLFGNTEVVGTPGNSDSGTAGNCVIITGVHTPPTTGSFTFSNVQLTSATDVFNSAAAGSANLVIENCSIVITNGFLFNIPNWTGVLITYNIGDTSTNNGMVNNTGGATCFFISATHGAGTGQTMVTSGPVIMQEVDLNCPWNAETGTTIACDYVIFTKTVTCSNNSTGFFNFCRFSTGATAAITMSSTAAITVRDAIIDTSNNPAIAGSGAGTFSYNNIIFNNNAVIAGTLTTTTKSWQPYSRAIASTDGTKVGTAAFNSAQFTVDSNGFVSLVGGGGGAIQSVGVDASTGPGTNPVLPNGSGEITVTGGQVAAGTTANVIRTDSLAANTYTVQIQRSQAVGSSTIGDNGVSHFNSANFSVDANGFVSVAAGSQVSAVNVDANTAPGTNPVVPNASNQITVTGGQVAAGTTANVIRTDSLAANTYTVQIQRSQAVASSTVGDNGVAHFNSAQFSVDSNGFVSALGNAINYTNVNHAASPYTVLTTDYYLSVDTSGGTVQLNFPNAPTFKQQWIVKDRTGTAATSNITLTTPGGTVTFDGLTTYTMNSNFQAVQLIANSTPTYEIY